MKAWLVTWEGLREERLRGAGAVRDRVAAVLPPQTSVASVLRTVELLYALHTATVDELARYARRPSSNPYRAACDVAYGATQERVTCGADPFLLARKVVDLEVETDPDTMRETVSWIDTPVFREEGGRVVPASEPERERVTRTRRGPVARRADG